MLEELGVPYEIKCYQRDKGTMLAPPSLKKVHPLGKSPVLEDNGLILAESGAIIEYLQEVYDEAGTLKPTAFAEHQQYRYWMHYAEGSLMPLLVMKLIFSRLGKPPMPWLIRPIAGAIGQGVQKNYLDKQIYTHMDYLEQHLSTHPYFAGQQFSAADIQMSFPIEAINARAGLEKYPLLKAWLSNVTARPAYQKVLENGGSFNILR
jgi:glutathione S-transferase